MEGEKTLNRSLLYALRKGGFIFYVRHGEANVGSDSPRLDFQDCRTQRNLSDFGRNQAIYFGEILRYLQIPIQYPVSASPFCRAIETTQLAFGRDNMEVSPFWFDVYRLNGDLPSGDRIRILNNLNLVLEKIPEEGRNQVIVAHSFPEGIGLGQMSDMGTVIIKPRGIGNGYQVVSQLSLSDLGTL